MAGGSIVTEMASAAVLIDVYNTSIKSDKNARSLSVSVGGVH